MLDEWSHGRGCSSWVGNALGDLPKWTGPSRRRSSIVGPVRSPCPRPIACPASLADESTGEVAVPSPPSLVRALFARLTLSEITSDALAATFRSKSLPSPCDQYAMPLERPVHAPLPRLAKYDLRVGDSGCTGCTGCSDSGSLRLSHRDGFHRLDGLYVHTSAPSTYCV
jgi:hypothetical protein